MDASEKNSHNFSQLPLLRFTSVVTVFIALDCLVCVSLWIAGGDSLYMEDSVMEFSYTLSTFDLACIAFLRCIALVICFYYLEQYILLESSGNYDQQKFCHQVVVCQVGIFLVSASSVLYGSIKGALVLRSVLQGTWNDADQELRMHLTYKVLSVTSVVFPGVEVFFGIVSSWWIKRMVHVERLRLIVNTEEDDNGKQVKKKADIMRIFLLAKPVSIIMWCT